MRVADNRCPVEAGVRQRQILVRASTPIGLDGPAVGPHQEHTLAVDSEDPHLAFREVGGAAQWNKGHGRARRQQETSQAKVASAGSGDSVASHTFVDFTTQIAEGMRRVGASAADLPLVLFLPYALATAAMSANPFDLIPKVFRYHAFCCFQQRPPRHPKGSCGSAGGGQLWDRLAATIESRRLSRVAVTATGCLGFCDAGPLMVVYPEGVWYQPRSESDIDEIVQSHFVEGRWVERLVVILERF